MDGLLIVDKPSGPTSHDVVFRARRALREKRIGHTGTLDPLASGVLPLVVGRATRLARFLSGDKTYITEVRLGQDTDTGDVQGQPCGPVFDGPWPDAGAVDAALTPFRGTFLQQPPAFSAKKIAGRRSYELARKARTGASVDVAEDAREAADVPPLPDPVSVTAHAVEVLGVDGPCVRLRVRCSAGFYIRSLAVDLGRALGTGAHLTMLRRTGAAGFGEDVAIPLETLQSDDGPTLAAARMVSMADMLRGMPTVVLTAAGMDRVRVGRVIGPADSTARPTDAELAVVPVDAPVRLLDPAGTLVAVATHTADPGFFHPSVVLV